MAAVALLLTLASFALGQSTERTMPTNATLATGGRYLVSNSAPRQILSWSVDCVPVSIRSALKGAGVKIAILDTGVDAGHPDLRVSGGVSFVDGTSATEDDNGHGTALAGIIAAQDNDIGVVGVSPGAEIYAVKVIGRDGRGDTGAVVKGIEWSIANHMHIINLSFGDLNQLPAEVSGALQKAYDAGILIVAGAGNSGQSGSPDSICYPARYEMVIAVGSTDASGERADFSSTGPEIDLVAPGTNITSCNNKGSYSCSSGTSFSAAYVSGIAALLISAGVGNNQELKGILEKSAKDLGAPGWDFECGYGLIDIGRAISTATSQS